MPFDAVGFSVGAGACPVAPRRDGGMVHAVRRWWQRMRRDVSDQPDPATTLAILRAARVLIGSEDGWVQGAYVAGDRRCVIGALERVGQAYGRRARMDAAAAVFAVARSLGFDSIERMNDSISHGAVLAAFDHALGRVSGT